VVEAHFSPDDCYRSQNERAENEIAVFSERDAEMCNAIRSYEKRKASAKKKRENLVVLTKTSRLNHFVQQNLQAATLKQWR